MNTEMTSEFVEKIVSILPKHRQKFVKDRLEKGAYTLRKEEVSLANIYEEYKIKWGEHGVVDDKLIVVIQEVQQPSIVIFVDNPMTALEKQRKNTWKCLQYVKGEFVLNSHFPPHLTSEIYIALIQIVKAELYDLDEKIKREKENEDAI